MYMPTTHTDIFMYHALKLQLRSYKAYPFRKLAFPTSTFVPQSILVYLKKNYSEPSFVIHKTSVTDLFLIDLKCAVSLNHVLTELVKQLGLILIALHKAKETQRQMQSVHTDHRLVNYMF